MAQQWRSRWFSSQAKGLRLQNSARSGAPTKFELEQVLHLFKLTGDDPMDYNRPISQWSHRELAEELIAQEIVPRISPRHVGRLLAEADLKPHPSG
jgi:putative transposase